MHRRKSLEEEFIFHLKNLMWIKPCSRHQVHQYTLQVFCGRHCHTLGDISFSLKLLSREDFLTGEDKQNTNAMRVISLEPDMPTKPVLPIYQIYSTYFKSLLEL